MDPKHVISLLQGEYTTVDVRFDASFKLYTYKTRLRLAKGDWVIVSVKDVLKVVEVVRVHSVPRIDFDAAYDYKWIVQKVDMTAYNATLEEEEKLQHHLDTLDRMQKRESFLAILEKSYPEGTASHDYFMRKLKPLLKD